MEYTSTTQKALTVQTLVNREHLDIDIFFSKADVPAMLDDFKELNINSFTISETSTSLMAYMKFFTDNGFKVVGIVEIKNGNPWDDKKIPAVLFERV